MSYFFSKIRLKDIYYIHPYKSLTFGGKGVRMIRYSLLNNNTAKTLERKNKQPNTGYRTSRY